MAVVLSATAAGVDRADGLAHRIPMVPPIGDTYVFDQDLQTQERWLSKLRDADDETRAMHRQRLEFVRAHGYLVSFLPPEGPTAYTSMRDATRRYESARMTPSQERSICASIGASPVDYHLREVFDDDVYDVGSIVLPIRDPRGGYAMTLRLAQLPTSVTGRQVHAWIDEARAVVQVLES